VAHVRYSMKTTTAPAVCVRRRDHAIGIAIAPGSTVAPGSTPLPSKGRDMGSRSVRRRNHLFPRGRIAIVDSTTLLRRTPAGDAELALPASGLSLMQRRILTLLDGPVRAGDLALGQDLATDRVCREASRLVHLGLAAVDSPVVEAATHPSAATVVRLGAPRLARRRLVAMLGVAAGALAWVGWHYAAQPAPPAASRTRASPALEARAPAPAAPEPAVIATRVLRGEPADRNRDAPKEPRQVAAKVAVPAAAADATRTPLTEPHAAVTPPAPAPVPVAAPAIAAPSPSAPPAATTPAATDMSPEAASRPSAHSPADNPAQLAPAEPPVEAPRAALPPIEAPRAAPAIEPVRAAAPSPLVPVMREAPEFPREATAQGVDRGTVKARVTVDAQGRVASVDILDAAPHRVFDRAVRNALARWQFEPGPNGRTTTVDVVFKRD
jgi:protein TonB